MNDKMKPSSASLPPAKDAPVYEQSPNGMNDAAPENLYAQMLRLRAERPAIEAKGREALRRLMKVAQRDTGQSRRVAGFLLSCYNGQRFPFDLTNLRGLDFNLFEDCLTVLRMDYQPAQEVHVYFERGGDVFEQLATDHGLTDVRKLQLEVLDLRAKLGID